MSRMQTSEEVNKKIEDFLASYEEELISAAKELDNQTMPPLTEELFSMFEKTGNRLCYENAYFMRRKFLSVYGIISTDIIPARSNAEWPSATGAMGAAHKLETVLIEICKEECWALPAHVDRKNNKNWRITIDLFAAETGAYLAELIGRLKDKISPAVYDMVKQEVFRRVLHPFMNSPKPYAWWEESEMNWCAVCNGSIGIAAIWLMDDKEALDKLLERICSSIMHYIDGFSTDGACLEGLGYYTYGLSFFVAFADKMFQYSKGRVNLFAGEKFRQIALFQQKCYLTDQVTLSFSDCGQKENFRVGLTAYLAMLYQDVSFPDFLMAANLESDNCYRYLILSRDIQFTGRYLESRKEHLNTSCKEGKTHIILPQAQWSVCRSENHAVLAVKGGHNDEPHNHNDIGSFLYVFCGSSILTDLGAGEYTKEYFNENRYHNLCCRSLGHNVPIINGMEQKAGKTYCASHFEADGLGRTVIGMEKAYGLPEGEKVTRTIDFHMENGNCKITDEFLISDHRNIVENLISCLEPELCDSGFFICAQGTKIKIDCPGGKDYKLIKEQYTDHYGKKKDAWLMQWSVPENKAEIYIEIHTPLS